MTKKELKEILRKHQKWLDGKEGGKKANLSNANLTGAVLDWANLSGAVLDCVDLSNASLYSANLSGANLFGADLYCANLSNAILYNANLSGANLFGADLHNTKLTSTDLHNANLHNTNLSGANLTGAVLDKTEKYRLGEILDKAIIGYKKCKDNVIVKLRIPKGAIVFGINGNKFRTNKAKVVSISGDAKRAVSNWDGLFIYEVGKTYTIKDFCLVYNSECGEGIHFFKTEDEAKKY